jgi:hypothetical protein
MSEPVLKKSREDALSEAEMHRMFPGQPTPIDRRNGHMLRGD